MIYHCTHCTATMESEFEYQQGQLHGNCPGGYGRWFSEPPADDAADLAALRAENQRLREALQGVTEYAQAMLEARVDSPEYVNWRGISDLARAALA